MYRNPFSQDDWYGVIIFPSRNLEPKNTTIHRPLLDSNKVRVIYLGELDDSEEQSDIITTIAVYKFSNLKREEVEAMLGIKLEETRVYREAKEEGREEGKQEAKLELVPAMLARGMSIEEVSELLGLTVEQVTQAAGNK